MNENNFNFSDKNPALSEFVSQIKVTADLQLLYDVTQKDSVGNNANDISSMDQS